jgi:hypothetical protein
MAKLVAADGARHAATYGAEIFGGYGICDEYPVSMFARDAYQIQFSPKVGRAGPGVAQGDGGSAAALGLGKAAGIVWDAGNNGRAR